MDGDNSGSVADFKWRGSSEADRLAAVLCRMLGDATVSALPPASLPKACAILNARVPDGTTSATEARGAVLTTCDFDRNGDGGGDALLLAEWSRSGGKRSCAEGERPIDS